MKLRPLLDSEADIGYRFICETVEWLLSKGIRQWPQPLPEDIYRQRQRDKENYCLDVSGNPVAVVSLLRESPKSWEPEIGQGSFWFISTLCTGNQHRGNNYGRKLLRQSLDYLSSLGIEEVFLGCVNGSGFLPAFYESFGFAVIGRKVLTYPSGQFDMLLMKWNKPEKQEIPRPCPK